MMIYKLVYTILLSAIVFYSIEHECRITHPNRQRILLISFDGFRWDYIHKTTNTTNFQRIFNNGVKSNKGLRNAFITKTLPNHYTLITGLYEESHGLIGNTFFDPNFNATFKLWDKNDARDSRWFDNGGEPIWVTNQKQGYSHHSGSIFWPGSAASVDGTLPTRYLEFDKNYPFKSRVDTMVGWLKENHFINLGLLYFEEPDATGHKFGPDSNEILQKVHELNEVLGYLLDQLEKYDLLKELNIIVTSDHGMTSTPADDEINLDKLINKNTYRIFTSNPIADIHPNTKELEDEIYKNLSNVPHLTVYRRDEIPAEYHYSKNRRIAPILAVADLHYWLSHNGSKGIAGNHGYNNSLPSMHPLFIAMGPAFKKNASVETFNNVDVYPLMCHILKLKPAPNNGTMDIVKHLLAESVDENSSSTIFIYILIFVIVGFVAGVFVLVAWQICKTNKYKARQLPVEFSRKVQFTKLDNVPLMDDQSDDEVQCAP